MKKLIVGCGLGLLIMGIAAAAAGYYFVYRPARAFMTSVTELGEVADLDHALTNTSTFTAPATGTLAPTQVERFMAVQSAVQGRMGSRFSELKGKYDQLDSEIRTQERTIRITEAVGAYRDLFGLIADARRAQVDALNAQQFSSDEYAWVRRRVFEAAGLSVTGVDFSELVDKARHGDFELPSRQGPTLDTPERGVPAQNRALVAPHVAALKDWVPYAMFGL